MPRIAHHQLLAETWLAMRPQLLKVQHQSSLLACGLCHRYRRSFTPSPHLTVSEEETRGCVVEVEGTRASNTPDTDVGESSLKLAAGSDSAIEITVPPPAQSSSDVI